MIQEINQDTVFTAWDHLPLISRRHTGYTNHSPAVTFLYFQKAYRMCFLVLTYRSLASRNIQDTRHTASTGHTGYTSHRIKRTYKIQVSQSWPIHPSLMRSWQTPCTSRLPFLGQLSEVGSKPHWSSRLSQAFLPHWEALARQLITSWTRICHRRRWRSSPHKLLWETGWIWGAINLEGYCSSWADVFTERIVAGMKFCIPCSDALTRKYL